MKFNDHKDKYIVAYISVFTLLFAVALLVILLLRTQLDKLHAHRAAVTDVENFIYQKYPTLDAATRRGHAEILIDSSCVEIVENTLACQGGGLTKLSPEVRQYALRVAEAHGMKNAAKP